MLDWLLTPIDPTRLHEVSGAVAWHGRAMAAAWGVFVPLGVLAARYLKLWPGQKWPDELDHPGWWHVHRAFQYLAAALTLVGLALILSRGASAGVGDLHRLLGWSAAGLAALQVVGAWLRGSKGGPTAPAPDGSWRGDHYDMTPRRLLFERVHKYGGYAAALLGLAALAAGLWLANAPRWMWLAIGLWWTLLLAVFVLLQRRGLAFDTYQAHWGADPAHPGNRRKPVGFGVRRHPPGDPPP